MSPFLLGRESGHITLCPSEWRKKKDLFSSLLWGPLTSPSSSFSFWSLTVFLLFFSQKRWRRNLSTRLKEEEEGVEWLQLTRPRRFKERERERERERKVSFFLFSPSLERWDALRFAVVSSLFYLLVRFFFTCSPSTSFVINIIHVLRSS